MTFSNRDVDEDTRTIFERVFYHVVRTSFDDDIMQTLIARAIALVNSDEDVQRVLARIDNEIEDIVNEAELGGFDE